MTSKRDLPLYFDNDRERVAYVMQNTVNTANQPRNLHINEARERFKALFPDQCDGDWINNVTRRLSDLRRAGRVIKSSLGYWKWRTENDAKPSTRNGTLGLETAPVTEFPKSIGVIVNLPEATVTQYQAEALAQGLTLDQYIRARLGVAMVGTTRKPARRHSGSIHNE